MRFIKSRDNGSTPKSSPAPGQGGKAFKPKYEFEFGDPSGEEDNDPDDPQLEREISRRLFLASLKSLAKGTTQQEHGPTSRHENEDPKANELFKNVPGYKEDLQPEGQRKRPTPFVCPPDSHVQGPAKPTRRVEGDDPAADELLAGASERQGPSQRGESPAPVSMVNEESPIVKLAREMRDTRLPGRSREKGEDPAADALFKTSARP